MVYQLEIQGSRVKCDGLCHTLQLVRINNEVYSHVRIDDLPEIMTYKPEFAKNFEFWLSYKTQEGIDERRRILTNCIELTVDKRKHNNF